jgi:hypothetical protein
MRPSSPEYDRKEGGAMRAESSAMEQLSVSIREK